ncbi:UDP-4-amino-4-deoxy-L-arabinoseaminotransferase [Methanoculleus bourgensis MS2]|uniref:UDP-4-amino-4-deoxy-L-arabinoseaminotransferase n=1 Tax=Methanoculleus bourgensis (strain ATCC 43281 / DSM 3045 / OCM 15 / MS2) TaxID=1201294 RepID=I7LND5_METBM|nr:DegT/DnrJ/EryC1/StrS family aminotransferase [Methanoculleus bourgensis]CCJ36994.1 UDP-4-amino-4-deoxy-L-arabinoseaminotransferase [Methanoculleus bourgensis MS2]
MQIPIAHPSLGNEENTAVLAVLASGMIAQGPETAAFEEEFAAYCGVPHAVATNNGTAALHAALLAAGVGPGDEVVVPAFTFFATASSVSMCGARPVFADVDPATATIDPADILAKVSPTTKAVIAVHLYGQPCDVGAVREVCDDKDLVFIEDAAQAHGATYRGQKTGSLGDLACFSFYATKNMATGEGGMVTTGSDEYDERLRRVINHGQSEKYLHTELGYNYRMTDINAAIGRVQLAKLDGFNRRRQENAAYYNTHITAPGLVLPAVAPGRTHVWHQYSLRVTDAFPLSRDELMAYLRERGIGCAVHYPVALSRQPFYAGAASCPVAESLAASVLSIPVHPGVIDEARAYIADTINGVV